MVSREQLRAAGWGLFWSGLLAIAIDRDGSVLEQQLQETVEGHIRPLARAIDGEIAQRDGRHAIVLPV